MSVAALGKYLGKQANLVCDGFQVTVKVVDAKVSYGMTRFFVVPVSGAGAVWVDVGRLVFEKEAA